MKRLLLVLAFCSSLVAVLAQTPTLPLLISYHGRVADSTGVLIGNTAPTNREVHFKIYNHKSDSGAANRLYTEKQTVTIANGEFSVLIGSGTVPAVTGQANLLASLEAAFNPTSGSGVIDRYLGISVADANGVMGAEIAPRQQIVTTAFALRAKVAEGLSGQVATAQIADISISNAKLGANSVTSDKILDGTITANDIAGRTITWDKVALGGIGGAEIADGSIGTADLANNAITTDKIGAQQVTAAKIANGTITRDQIASKTIKWDQIQEGGVGGLEIADGNIGTIDLADSLITTAKLADGAVTAPRIADGAVTSAKLASALTFAGDATFTGYPTFSGGIRANVGLNINNAGVLGNTVTIQTGKHPAQPTVEDTNALVVRDFAGTNKFVVTKEGQVSAAGGLGVGNSAVVVGQFSVNTAVGSDTTMVVRGRSSADTYLANFANESGTSCFYITRFGNAQLAGNLTQASDRRLKHNIAPIAGSLEKLLRLRSVTFEYNDTTKFKPGIHAGFIAQEMEEVFPDWVFTESDGMKSIGFRGFESLTVQALRELRAEKDQQLQQRDATIAALEKNVAAMKAESADTKAQLAALQQAVAALSARASN